jgi:hypothetical protein
MTKKEKAQANNASANTEGEVSTKKTTNIYYKNLPQGEVSLDEKN